MEGSPPIFDFLQPGPNEKYYSTGTKGGIELKQIRVQKNVDQIFFGTTKCWVHAILGPKQFGGQKNFGPTQILGPAIFLGQKQISGLKQIFGLKKFWVRNNFWVHNKFWVQNKFWIRKKNLVPK